MGNRRIQAVIKRAVETADFSRLYDYFAAEVELKVTLAVASSGREERRGKKSVTDYFADAGRVEPSRPEPLLEVVANGDRIVAIRDETFVTPGGLAVRDECALVFDVLDGCITRVAIHHELLPVVIARPGSSSMVRNNQTNRHGQAAAIANIR